LILSLSATIICGKIFPGKPQLLFDSQIFLTFNFAAAILPAILISLFSYLFKLLTFSGASAVFVLAFLIFGIGGWQWTVPILTFFILSSFLSKIRQKKKPGLDNTFAKTGRRDALQVIANGGAAAVIILLFAYDSREHYYFAYVSSIAAVCADTWATEAGTFFNNKTYNILNFKEVEQGTSGGVSAAGFVASLAGAFVIALSSLIWVNENISLYICIVVAAGFFGSIVDSIGGSVLQSQHKCSVCSLTIEKNFHCGTAAARVKGIKFISNDFINILCAVTGGLTGYYLSILFKV
jgi:uncharacterized protein (TIGR00297 family)